MLDFNVVNQWLFCSNFLAYNLRPREYNILLLDLTADGKNKGRADGHFLMKPME